MFRARFGVTMAALAAVTLAACSVIHADEKNPPAQPVGAPRMTVGPSLFGYISIDSNEPDGPQFTSMTDISATGTRVTFLDADALPDLDPNIDDGVALDISLASLNNGDGFPFFGAFQTSVNMSTNGFLHFDQNAFSDDIANQCSLPNIVAGANNLIAPLWDDLVLGNPPADPRGGYFRAFSPCPYSEGGDGDCVVFQWDNADYFGGAVQSFDFQAVLYASGNILFVYGQGNPEEGLGSTTGIENADATDGLTHACDEAGSIPADFEILFVHPEPLITFEQTVSVCQEDPNDPNDPECAETCGTETSLVVAPGTQVRYCYRVTNTGPTPIFSHDLVDDIAGDIFIGNALIVLPGDSAFFTRKVTITADVTSEATWTAFNTIYTVSASATVTIQVDSDGDGIPDDQDICPDGDDDVDTDGDTVPDACDNCPSDANAGQEDGDNDDAGDACDECPNDSQKSEPGDCGCGVAETDTDNDGTPNCDDDCPNDPDKTEPGECGCGQPDTDSDDDGTLDCDDACPDDADKTEPGDCGCGESDADSDGDGVLDCDDGCPDDAEKAQAGVCGCGTPEEDSDGDGVLDCVDNCPENPNASQADADGDGIGDACDDTGELPGVGDGSCGTCASGSATATVFLMPMLLLTRRRYAGRRRR